MYLSRDEWMIHLISAFPDPVAAVFNLNKLLLLFLNIVATWTMLVVTRVFFWEGMIEKRSGKKVPVLLTALFRSFILLLAAVFMAVVVFNISQLTVALLLAGFAAIIAVFFRDFLVDFFAGLSISLDQGINIGAVLKQSTGLIGTVEQMHWRSVSMRLQDGTLAIVPNSTLARDVVINLDSLGWKEKISMDLTLDFSLPVERGLRVLAAALASAGRRPGMVQLPAAEAIAFEPGLYGVSYRLLFYYSARDITEGQARSIVTAQVMNHLSKTGLTLSLPKQNVFVGEARMLSRDWSESVDREALMGDITLFSTLEAQELRLLADAIVLHYIEAGKDIIQEGDTSTSMYGLAEGLLEVTVNNSGKSLVVAEMEPGNFFGEMSMLAGEPRSATVTAVVDSMVFELQRESFSQVLNAREGLAESISQLVVERQMSNNEKLQDASRAELDEAISGASINLRDRIRAVFSLFRAEL
jgi:CRP-like cAMP-binding protein/small-conductance mechanosensitive channel